jgi:molecular chaperone GrpE
MTGGRPDERGSESGSGQAPGPSSATADDARAAAGAVDDEGVETEDAAGAPAEGGASTDPVADLRRERDEYLDMVRRVQADFENYKKRMVRQQTELLERAAEGLVVRLLPVLDAFDLARAHLEAESSPEGKALLQAAGLLEDTLAKEGLERVDQVGAEFDPTVHEAVEHQPEEPGAEETAAGPVVTGVLRAGYRYKGRVVRPAMVRVRG